jgi:isopropylmalate/homocitrate/citramalate synthase
MLKNIVLNVEFSAEDAMRSDPAFLAKIIYEVIAAGATL